MGEKLDHWADQIADEVMKSRGKRHLIATGITPSGPIHLGNIREVVTAYAIHRALQDRGAISKLIYIADTSDPLRKVYPFLPKTYVEYVGMPLYRIPDPEGCCENYAEHYLKPFLEALCTLGIRLTVYRAHELYAKGIYSRVIEEALINRSKIASIIEEKTGRDLPFDWMPFNVECENCGSITKTKVTGIIHHQVEYSCGCGYSGVIEYSRGGKLLWRVDWPARWKALGVTIEPFGKDHATAGGSYDTGSEISQKVFGYQPPYPIVYEWIYLRGKGAMASSTGVAISIKEMLQIVPPEIVHFLILRTKPGKHIEFDPVRGLLQLIEEYQDVERSYFSGEGKDAHLRRLYELCQTAGIPEKIPPYIPFMHMVIATQIAGADVKHASQVLKRSGYSIDPNQLAKYLKYARNWLDSFAPDDFKFTVREELPSEVAKLSHDQKRLLARLADNLKNQRWEAEGIHNNIHEVTKELGITPSQAFQAIYLCLLGKRSGPRAGWFISSLGRDFVINRFLDASKS
ncbi:MAG: lysine--tRNA ligase [Actinomycetota bacterium]|nr:lysine--tRNA ligase [Actinomycetota bacterium]